MGEFAYFCTMEQHIELQEQYLRDATDLLRRLIARGPRPKTAR